MAFRITGRTGGQTQVEMGLEEKPVAQPTSDGKLLKPGQLSEHFHVKQFGTDDPKNISTTLVEALEKLRAAAGGRPVIITPDGGGFRTPSGNKSVSGSQHLFGAAADIHIPDMSVDEMVKIANSIPEFANGGIGAYPNQNFIHVDVRGKKARWGRIDIIDGGKQKAVYTTIEKALGKTQDQIVNPDLTPDTVGLPNEAEVQQEIRERFDQDLKLVEDALVGVVADPQTPEQVHQTVNHVVEQLVANPMKTGDFTRGAIGRWLYGGTDADAKDLPLEMSPEVFLKEVMGIDYPESATKDLKFDKDVPGLVNVMGWLGAGTVEAIRQTPLLATDIVTDPLTFLAHPAIASMGNSQKFGAGVWAAIKKWFSTKSETKLKVREALGPTQHMPQAFTKFEQMRADIAQKQKELFIGQTRPIHKVFEEANAKLGRVPPELNNRLADIDARLSDLRRDQETALRNVTESERRRLEDLQDKIDFHVNDPNSTEAQIAALEQEFTRIVESHDLDRSFIRSNAELRQLRVERVKIHQEIKHIKSLAKWTPQDLRAIGFNEVLNDADQAAFILTLTEEANLVQDVARSGNLKEFYNRLRFIAEDLTINHATRTASGRAQRILQEEQAEAMKIWSKQLMEIFENRQLSPQELMRNIALMDRPQDLIQFVNDSTRPGFMAMVAEMSVNGLLGGGTTMVVNAASGPMMMMYHGLNRTAAGLFNWNRKGLDQLPPLLRTQGVTGREGVDFLTGALFSAGEGLRAFKKAFMLEEALTPGTKFDTFRRKAITGDNAAAVFGGVFKIPIIKLMVDGYGTLTRLTGRTLLATDEMNKAMIMRGEIKALSSRVARDEAARLFPNDAQAALDHYNRVKQDVIINPETYKDVFRSAQKRAQELTFTNPSNIKLVRDYSNFVSQHPGFRLVTPFVNVPVNILQTATDMIPTTQAMKLVYDLVKKGLSTNDPVKRQMTMAKLATSTSLASGIGAAIYTGHITGAGPSDPRQRQLMEAAGWKPYSIKYDSNGDGVNDKYIEYSRLDPFAFTVGAMVDFYEALGWLEGVDDGTGAKPAGWYANKAAVDFSLAVFNNMEDATFISSAEKFFELTTAIGSRDPDKIGRAVAKFSQVLVPFSGTQKMFTRELDPAMREVRDWVDGVRAVVPGSATMTLSDQHPMKPFFPGDAPVLAQSYSALGQPQFWHNGLGPQDLPNWLSEYIPDAAQVVANALVPIRVSNLEDTRLQEIATTFLENNVELSRPDRQKDGFDIPIIHYDAMQRLVAQGTNGLPQAVAKRLRETPEGRNLLRTNLPPLVDQLHELVKNPVFQRAGAREQKQALVSSLASKRRNWAFGVMLLIDPDLREQYTEHLAIIKQHGQPVETNPLQRAF